MSLSSKTTCPVVCFCFLHCISTKWKLWSKKVSLRCQACAGQFALNSPVGECLCRQTRTYLSNIVDADNDALRQSLILVP